MFTGIIDHCGCVTLIKTIRSSLRLEIKHSFDDIVLGESVAIDGICLTVAECKPGLFACDVSPETGHITTIKHVQQGQQVNLERALQPTSRMGGHFVTGHVDQTAQILSLQPVDDFIEMRFGHFDDLMQRFLIKKGSIAINGVSLTINEVENDTFKVMLIPHTLERTNLGNLKAHDWVNIEFDILARTVVKQLESLIQ